MLLACAAAVGPWRASLSTEANIDRWALGFGYRPCQLPSPAQEHGWTIPWESAARVTDKFAAGPYVIKSYCCVIDPLGAWEPLTATKLLPPVAIVPPPEIEKFVLLS